jgi:hypothetical protein
MASTPLRARPRATPQKHQGSAQVTRSIGAINDYLVGRCSCCCCFVFVCFVHRLSLSHTHAYALIHALSLSFSTPLCRTSVRLPARTPPAATPTPRQRRRRRRRWQRRPMALRCVLAVALVAERQHPFRCCCP